MKDIKDATVDQVNTWGEISNLIFNGGYKEGFEIGYSEGINTYSFRRRFFYKTFEFFLGILIGAFLAAPFVLMYLFS